MLKKLSVAIAAAILASCAAPKSPQTTEPASTHDSTVNHPVRDKAATAQQVADALWQDEVLSSDVQQGKLEQYNNLWHRVTAQFSMPIPQHNSDIEAKKRFYLRHQMVLKQATANAAPFLYHIVTELEKRKLPLELALLPIVESSYNPKAGSASKVLGAWQFNSMTAKNFGLQQNVWFDGRRDVVQSSKAAFDYLKYIYSNADQDWLSAIAGFNSGENRVFKAIEQNKKVGKATDFWSLQLPSQSTSYIPKLLALAELMKHPDKYAITIPEIANKPQTRLVKINRSVDLEAIAPLVGISLKGLQRLNPGFKSTTAPNDNYVLVLPLDSAEDIKQQIAALPKVKLKSEASQYRVRPGDSLSKIAARFKTTVPVLSQANQLKNAALKVGQVLWIPGTESNNSQTEPKASKQVEQRQTYQVKAGDTLWQIAKKLNVSTKDLQRWNKLTANSALKPGQSLQFYADSRHQEKKMTYQVKTGDSFASIAQKFKVKVADILKWNGLSADNYLHPGQELTLYIAG